MNSSIYLIVESVTEAYKQGLSKLFTDKFKIQSDAKIAYESRAYFEIKDSERSDISISENQFRSKKDYNKIHPDGQKQMEIECKYYSETILRSGKLKRVLDLLREDPSSKKAVIAINIPPLPSNNKLPPCMMYISFRWINNHLDIAGHMRANNAYGICLVNMKILQAVHQYAANELGLELGTQTHIVDSYHIYKTELDKLKEFVK